MKYIVNKIAVDNYDLSIEELADEVKVNTFCILLEFSLFSSFSCL